MTRGAIFAVDGFVESHVTYATHRLREDGIAPEFATPTGDAVEGERGMTVSDTLGAEYGRDSADLDFVVVPGGPHAERDLPADVRSWLRGHLCSGGVFACLGTGLAVLVDLDELDGRLVTGPPSLAQEIKRAGGEHTGERVTVDGALVTGRDTDALPFFLAAVRNTLAIPQDPDVAVRRRPFQERVSWGGE